MDARMQRGLTADEVAERVARGETNAVCETTSRSYADIFRENVFTLFNLILGVLVAAVLLVGSPKDALFGLVLVFNAAIGVIQEIRAKRTLDRLQLLSAPRVRVLRDGEPRELALAEVVRDDVVLLAAGDQVPADGPVLASDGLELDESLLTGESVPVDKAPGDEALSGSFVVAGTGSFRAARVGEQAYVRRLSAEARRFGLVRSELRAGVDGILKVVLWAMLPIGILTIASQVSQHAGVQAGTVSTVAALEAMVPQGLVLLTSIAFAYSVILLGRRDVLVQELAAVEVLARVDVVCVDKTGTLTEPALEVERLEPLAEAMPAEEALGAVAALESNATARVLASRWPAPAGWDARSHVTFSSGRKWSGADFAAQGTWVLGAPEVLLASGAHEQVRESAAREAATGGRVLLLARTGEPLTAERPPARLEPAALVVLAERIRLDAAETLRYFRDQGVAVKVLSGDSPATVAAVAERCGLAAADPVDARALPAADRELVTLVDAHTVFGRITPDDKRRVVTALKAAGHTVAMTGDGVNDVPALKAADLGIAMGSGARAARAVAPVVLLDARFATLPRVMAEGRRVTANIERVANLFLTKTVWAVLLALAAAVAVTSFPLLPRHITIVDALTIGIPSFFLALAPNPTRYRPGFLARVLRFALPAGLAASVAAFGSYLGVLHMSGTAEARTAATLTLTLVGLWVLGILARPLVGWRAWLLAAMAVGLPLVILVPFSRAFFALALLPPQQLGLAAAAGAGGIVLLELGVRIAGWRGRQ